MTISTTITSIAHGSVVKDLVIIPGMSVEDIGNALKSSFGCPERIIGVADAQQNVYFPLSLMTHTPNYFSNRPSSAKPLQLVLEMKTPLNNELPSHKDESDKVSNSHSLLVNAQLRFHYDDILEMKDTLESLCSDNGTINESALIHIFNSIESSSSSKKESQRTIYIMEKLFDAFKIDNSDEVDATQYLSGISLLSFGDYDEKIKLAFELHDTDNDGFIAMDEMLAYLKSVYYIIFHIDPSIFTENDTSADEVAIVTTLQCYEDMNKDKSSLLSFEEFKKWYSTSGVSAFHQQGATTTTTTTAAAMPVVASTIQDNLPPPHSSLKQMFHYVQSLLCLSVSKIQGILELGKTCSVSGCLNMENFTNCLWQALENIPVNETQAQMINTVFQELFFCFDGNDDAFVDIKELATGLYLIGVESNVNSARETFNLFDSDGDEMISPREMLQYFKTVFRVLYKISDSDVLKSLHANQVSPLQLAEATVEEAFKQSDLNEDGFLSFNEFERWYKGAPFFVGNIPVSDIHDGQQIDSFSFRDIRSLSNLWKFPPEEIFCAFGEVANNFGYIDFSSFSKVMNPLLSSDLTEAFRIRFMQYLFILLDTNNSGGIDFNELAAGLSVFCGGTLKEKCDAAFALFDVNEDGFISLNEMESYLLSVFRVILRTQPNDGMVEIDTSVKDLAVATSVQCFMEYDLNMDGLLSYEEFSTWFYNNSIDTTTTTTTTTTVNVEANSGIVLPSLRKLKESLGSEQLNINNLFEALALQINEDGNMKKDGFYSAFDNLFKEPVEYDLLSSLFDIFDGDNTGVVNFTDLASGLSVLCDGDLLEKSRAAFNLFDKNNRGLISLTGFSQFLTAIFKFMYVVDPQSRLDDVSPDVLAETTASTVFEEFGLHSASESLSFHQFVEWYSDSTGSPPTIVSSMDNASKTSAEYKQNDNINSTNTLRFVRESSGLASLELNEVFKIFTNHAETDGSIHQSAFYEAFGTISKSYLYLSKSPLDAEAMAKAVGFIWDGLQHSESIKLVDLYELIAALSILCSPMNLINHLCDVFNSHSDIKDGYVDLRFASRYLFQIFNLVFTIDPDSFNEMECDPETLSLITATECFKELTTQGEEEVYDGAKVSLYIFFQWYHNQSNSKSSTSDESVHERDEISLHFARIASGFEYVRFDDAVHLFRRVCDVNGNLRWNACYDAFKLLCKYNQSNAKTIKSPLARTILHRIFRLFDVRLSGSINMIHFISVLSLLCSGDESMKSSVLFNALDLHGEGLVHQTELLAYMTSVYKLAYEFDVTLSSYKYSTNYHDRLEELASQWYRGCISTSKSLFKDNDTTISPLSYETFHQLLKNNGIFTEISIRKFVNSSDMNRESNFVDTNGVSLESIGSLSGLSSISINEAILLYANETDSDGLISKEGFLKVFGAVDQQAKQVVGYRPNTSAQNIVISKLFDIFDTDNNGIVDFVELISGLSILCGGSIADKAYAVFQLFDYNQDGYLSFNDLKDYLLSVFKVIYTAEPNSEIVGVSPQALASATATQCFNESGFKTSVGLSLDQFRSWMVHGGVSVIPSEQYQNTKTGEVSSMKATLQQQSEEETFSLSQIMFLTQLDTMSPSELFELIASYSDDEGLIAQASFNACFDLLLARSNVILRPFESFKRRLLLGKVFALFEIGDSHTADFTEICSGLSVLCSGDLEVKCLAIYSMFDFNQEGVISVEEITRLLTSIYKLIYASTEANLEDSDPLTLARSNIDACLKDLGNNNTQDNYHHVEYRHFKTIFLSSVPSLNKVVTKIDGLIPSFSEMKHGLYLGNVSAPELFESLAKFVNDTGVVDRRSFFCALLDLYDRKGIDSKLPETLAAQFFDILDGDKEGFVDFPELAVGLSVLCGGSAVEKAKASFDIFDYNVDGLMVFDDMVRYLHSVYRIMVFFNVMANDDAYCPGLEISGITPLDMAKTTAQQCFDDCDLDKDGSIDFADFFAWYNSDGNEATHNDIIMDPKAVVSGLNELIKLTSLSDEKLSDVFYHFFSLIDHNSLPSSQYVLSKDQFINGFLSYIKHLKNTDDSEREKSSIKELFLLFDVNSDGRIDQSELVSGLSVLCGGLSKDDQSQFIFKVLDFENKGYISLNSMQLYLSLVFRLTYHADPELESVLGVSPDQLAEVTAIELFNESGSVDDKLFYEAFQHIYNNAASNTLHNTIPTSSVSLSLDSIREKTGLEQLNVLSLLEVFDDYTLQQSVIDRNAFMECFESLIRMSEKTVTETIALIGSYLYDIFDHGDDGIVPASEIISGLTVFCAGTVDEKARVAFTIYDSNNDGSISKEEMFSYLCSIFRIVYSIESDVQDKIGASVRSLARETVDQCFLEAGKDSNNNNDDNNTNNNNNNNYDDDGEGLSFSEFKEWYSSNEDGELVNVEPESLSISQLRDITGLVQFEFSDIVQYFLDQDKHNTEHLSWDEFYQCMIKLPVSEKPDASKYKRQIVIHSLFKLFDVDQSNKIETKNILSGFSVLCSGGRYSKARVAFDLHDSDEDGFISFIELQSFLKGVYRVVFSTDASIKTKFGVSFEILANINANKCFKMHELDINGELLSYESFVAWYTKSDKDLYTGDNNLNREIRENSSHYDVTLKELSSTSANSTSSASYSLSLAQIKTLTNLDQFSLKDVVDVFAAVTDENGFLNRENFIKALRSFGGNYNDDISIFIFNLFDTDDNGIVDFIELSCGLVVLSGGRREEKVKVVFSLFDLDGDGSISFDEMTTFLTSVFKLTYAADPVAASEINVSPDDLAAVTADQCFSELDLPIVSRLSYDNFKYWYDVHVFGLSLKEREMMKDTTVTTTSSNGSSGSDGSVTAPFIAASEDALRAVTGLAYHTVGFVQNELAKMTDSRGLISRSAFHKALDNIFQQTVDIGLIHDATNNNNKNNNNNNNNNNTRQDVIDNIFNTFDEQQDGSVDFVELSCGLSVLCLGDRQQKIKSAFALFDIVGNGYIEIHELELYLRSVFKVLFGIQSEIRAKSGVNVNELASMTAAQCFSDCDVDGNGIITLTDFQQWYESKHNNFSISGVLSKRSLKGDEILSLGKRETRSRRTTSTTMLSVSPVSGERRFHYGDEDYSEYIDHSTKTVSKSKTSEIRVDNRESDVSSVDEEVGSIDRESLQSMITLIQKLTKLDQFEVHEVFDIIYEQSYGKKHLTYEMVNRVFKILNTLTGGSHHDSKDNSNMDDSSLDSIISRLFSIFNVNENGTVDYVDFASGISVLCGGSRQSKVMASFALYDVQNTGTISIEQMTRYLTSVFKMIYEFNPKTGSDIGVTATELAQMTADQCFADSSTGEHEEITLETFSKWYTSAL